MAGDKEKLEQMKELLKQMFQFDNSDLDFGIYRIMGIKRKEISKFIDVELVEYVKKEMKSVMERDARLDEQIREKEQELKRIFGENKSLDEIVNRYSDVDCVVAYLELKKRERSHAFGLDLETDVYNHIINFFSRYYDDGDFISKRRYSKDPKYAIPYNGQEVYLYWVNQDQYYIKTTEQFSTYAFKVAGLRVQFEVKKDDVEVDQNNVKASEKRFFIVEDCIVNDSKNEIIVQFAYRSLTEDEEKLVLEQTERKTVSRDLVNKMLNLKRIKEKTSYQLYFDQLTSKHVRADGTVSDKSEIAWHLNKYTAKNTTDYFIHKDLGGFLRRELDFYIKNEMFYVDEILDDWEQYDINLKKIRVFKKICLKIIDFLAQIEDFQKKLWEKKKFVVSTDYCITLDYIDEKYYPEILSNEKQLEEWKKLFDFDVKEKMRELEKSLTGYSGDNLEIEVLKQHPTLTIDTRFFDEEFKYKILSEIDNLDEKINGILINSENFQALNLLLGKYREKVKCCYIDPPYNTGNDGFLYKDGFNHSSWLSMMENRLSLGKDLLREDGAIFISIDDNELVNLRKICDNTFGENNFLAHINRITSKGSKNDAKYFISDNDYILVYSKYKPLFKVNKLKKENLQKYTKCDEIGYYKLRPLEMQGGGEDSLENRPNMGYSIYYNPKNKDYQILFDYDLKSQPVYKEPSKELLNKGYICIRPTPSKGKLGRWRWSSEYFLKNLSDVEIDIVKKRAYTKDRKKNYIELSPNCNLEIINTQGTLEISDLFNNKLFDFPKPSALVDHLLKIGADYHNIIIDFFAGSGTTGHAVLKLNKEDGGNRKFILVEMAQYFDTVLKPRIQKVIYSQNWKDGKPQDNDGSNKQIIKYQRLEQYEDTLNNIEFEKPNPIAQNTKDYKIKYMLEFESKNSKVFLNLDGLEDPFNYTLKIQQKDGSVKDEKVDLVETFNYIAGIEVSSISMKIHNSRRYVVIRGERKGNPVIVIWRNIKDNFDPVEDKKFIEEEILKGEEFSEILTNGNSLVKGAKSLDELFKAAMMNERGS